MNRFRNLRLLMPVLFVLIVLSGNGQQLLPVPLVSTGDDQSRSIAYNRQAAVQWALEYYDNPEVGSGQCTGLVGGAMAAGGLSGANQQWIGNHQLIGWMEQNPTAWIWEWDISALQPGDIALFSYLDWNGIKAQWPYSFTHSALITTVTAGGNRLVSQWNLPATGLDIMDVRITNAQGNSSVPVTLVGVRFLTVGTNPALEVVSSDYDGDGRVDLSTKANNGDWRIDFAANGFGSWDTTLIGMGDNSSIFVPADYDGDGKTDFSMKSPAGDWYIDYAPSFGGWNAILPGYGDNSSFYLAGDFNGDRVDDFSMKSPAGDWYIDYGPSLGGWSDIFHGMGDNSSIYLVGDFNGDDTDDLSMKSPAGDWYIDYGPSLGGWNDIFHGMGDNSSIYFVGDFNGDGADDLSMKSPAGDWYIDLSPSFGNWDQVFHGFGDNSSSYRAGKYDADDVADLFMVAPNGELYVDYACNGFGGWDALNFDCTNHTNQLANAGFEIAGSTNRLAQGWQGVNLLLKDRRLCTSITKPVITAEGNCVFQFKGGSSLYPARKLKQVITPAGWGSAGETLTFSANVSGNKFQAGARIQLKVVYTDNTVIKKNVAIPPGTYGFTEIAGSLPLTKPVKNAVVMLDVKRVAGRLRVDKLWLSAAGAGTRLIGVLAAPAPVDAPDTFRGSN